MNKAKTNPVKEMFRKMIVSLKRKPQTIALIMLCVSFLVYSMNLSYISNTTAKIQGVGMGFAGFCTMLLSILSFICFVNAFPHRKKVNIPMLVLMFIMFGIIIGCDIYYSNAIAAALTRAENAIQIGPSTLYIIYAYNMLANHQYCMFATIALVVTLPFYSKLIRKIKTSVDVEDNGELAALELSND